MFPLGPGIFSWPASIAAAGAWLIVAVALGAGLVAWAAVEVLERIRRQRRPGQRAEHPAGAANRGQPTNLR